MQPPVWSWQMAALNKSRHGQSWDAPVVVTRPVRPRGWWVLTGKDCHRRPWSLLVLDVLKPPSIPSALVSCGCFLSLAECGVLRVLWKSLLTLEPRRCLLPTSCFASGPSPDAGELTHPDAAALE